MAQVPFSGTFGIAVDLSTTDAVFAQPCRALWVGVTGNIACIDMAGNAITFANVPVGFFPMTLKQVTKTGTTASSIIAVF